MVHTHTHTPCCRRAFLTNGQVSHALIRSTGNGLCNQKPVTRVNYQPNSGVDVQLVPDLVGDFRDVIQFMILSMLGKSLRSDRQMAGKVGQVNCREKLDGIGIWICGESFELPKDRCSIFPVRQENIVKQRCQLLDLTWNRHIACFNCH